jgi:hypothetical protein
MDDAEKLDRIYENSIETRHDMKHIKATLDGTMERPESGLIHRVERIEKVIQYMAGAFGLATAAAAFLAWAHGLWPFNMLLQPPGPGNK